MKIACCLDADVLFSACLVRQFLSITQFPFNSFCSRNIVNLKKTEIEYHWHRKMYLYHANLDSPFIIFQFMWLKNIFNISFPRSNAALAAFFLFLKFTTLVPFLSWIFSRSPFNVVWREPELVSQFELSSFCLLIWFSVREINFENQT